MIKKLSQSMSFQSKVLAVLLSITILLSGFSLILVQSIGSIDQVGNRIKDGNIPEILWLTYWEKDLLVKEYMMKDYIENDKCCEFVSTFPRKTTESQLTQNQPLPPSLTDIKREIELLDFMVLNNIQGLIAYGDEEAAKAYIQEIYLPQLAIVKKDVIDFKLETVESLNHHSDKFSIIIEESLWFLLILTLISICLSIFASYRISRGLTRPIENMMKKVDQIAGGKYGLMINEKSQVELQQLTNSVNQMSLKLKESFQTILRDKLYHEQILNSLPVGIMTMDDKTSEMSINLAGKALLEINEEMLNNRDWDIGENQQFWGLFSREQGFKNAKVKFETSNQTYQLLVSHSELLDHEGIRIGRIFYFIDITETEELEKRIHQSEKLALVGEIAAGAAHEIRNPLAVIHGFLSLMNQTFSKEEKKKFYLPLLLRELERINLIIEEMLLQAKPGAPILKEAFIEDITNEILPLIVQSLAEHNVDIKVELDRIPLCVDRQQIKQALHNLIRNSVEAMEYNGQIRIYSVISQGFYVLFIEDDGPGIPPQLAKTIFEPFSTTKDSGTGLGLTIVQRIIENHGGQIEVAKTSSKGTTFLIKLPLSNISQDVVGI